MPLMKYKSNAFFRRSLKVIGFKEDKNFQTVPIQVLYLILHGLTSFVHILNGALPCNGTLGANDSLFQNLSLISQTDH